MVAYEENGMEAKGLDYAHLTVVLLETVKGQQVQIRELQNRSGGIENAPGRRSKRNA